MGTMEIWGRERVPIDAWLIGQRLVHQWPDGPLKQLGELLEPRKGKNDRLLLRPIYTRQDMVEAIIDNEKKIIRSDEDRAVVAEALKELMLLPPTASIPIDIAN